MTITPWSRLLQESQASNLAKYFPGRQVYLRSALRRFVVASSIVGSFVAVLSVATIRPLGPKEMSLHHLSSVNSKAASKAHRRSYTTTPHRLLSGIGSWYGDLFDGRETAVGRSSIKTRSQHAIPPFRLAPLCGLSIYGTGGPSLFESTIAAYVPIASSIFLRQLPKRSV